MPKRKLLLPPLKELFRQRDDLIGLSAAAQLIAQLGEVESMGTLDKEAVAKALAAYDECEQALCKSEADKESLSQAVLGGLLVGLEVAGTPAEKILRTHQRNAGLARYAQSEKKRCLDEIAENYATRRDEFNSIQYAAEYYEQQYEKKPHGPKYDAILKHIKKLK